MQRREPSERDWRQIKMLADASVADVAGASVQDEWLTNRRGFQSIGEQYHFVVEEEGEVKGYGSLEHAFDAPEGNYRMFVVTAPDDLERVGQQMFEELEEMCTRLGARRSCFVEYSNDERLLGFLKQRGYEECGTLLLEPEVWATVVEKFYGDS